MKNVVRVRSRTTGKRIDFDYSVEGPWSEAFQDDSNPTWISFSGGFRGFYSEYEVDVSSVPDSIAVIPFLVQLLPMAWIYDATIYVDEIDKTFFDSVENVRAAYSRMYPQLTFKEDALVGRPVENVIRQPRSAPLVLFSGGVDAVFAMLGYRAVRPTLLTVWGCDVFFNPNNGWDKVRRMNDDMARRFGLDLTSVKSSFRFFQHYPTLDAKVAIVQDNWWHGFQHGIGLLGLAAPLAWARETNTIAIASSFSYKDPWFTCCASDPSIDTALRFFDCSCHHFDYTITRQEKVAFICEESDHLRKEIPLRVCWHSTDGDNCCECEKCLRTIFAIYAEGRDPRRFNFAVEEERLVDAVRSGKVKRVAFWNEIVDRLSERPERPQQVKALLDFFERT